MNPLHFPLHAVAVRRGLGMVASLAVAAGTALPAAANTITYNFDDATLQGWNNRVWDLAANGGAGGWVDLPANVTTMPGTINGGVIQPPLPGNNGLFAPRDSAVGPDPASDTDNHLNTLWLRSPDFYLDGSGNLTVQLSRGKANTAAPANEAAVSYAATNGGGWKGVILRRVSDNAFVLAKPRTVDGNDWTAVTFTQAELAAHVSVTEKYTLELINSDWGSWGWLMMDNVSIPAIEGEPVAPTGLVATAGASAVELTWDVTPRATGYKVKRSTTSGSGYVEIGTTTLTNFTDPGPLPAVPHYYVVTGTNAGGEGVPSAEATATPSGGTPSSAKDILTFSIDGLGAGVISGSTIFCSAPRGTNLTALRAVYTDSPFASGSPASGTTQDFTSPKTYTITAEDGTTKTYTVSVPLLSMDYYFVGGLEGWTQIYPTAAGFNLYDNNGLGAGGDNSDTDPYTRFGRSPEFYLVNGAMSFYFDGGRSELAAPHVGPTAIPELAINEGGFAGVALRDVVAETYVLSRRKPNDGGGYQRFEFTAAELAPFVNDGKKYTVDYLDYNRGGWGWTYMSQISIPGVTGQPGAEAWINSIRIGSTSHSEIFDTDVTVWVPAGTNLTALNPVIGLSPGATISPPVGTVRDFSTPQTYTVTSGDTLTSNDITVTVIEGGGLNVKTYDTTNGASFLDPIANLQAVTPSASAVTLADIDYFDNFIGSLPGITSGDSFSVLWEGWFDVSLDGPGDYTFGTQSDDGSVLYLDLNNDGDFTDPGELVVNNNGDHGFDIKTASVHLAMDSVRIAIGFYEAGGGDGMHARFGKGKALAFGALQDIGGTSGHFLPTQPASDPSAAALWYFTHLNRVAQPKGSPTELLLNLPFGTSITNIAPTFQISPGATCDPPSGTARDFTTPQTYTVTSQDLSTQTTYTVIVRVATAFSRKSYDTSYGAGMLAPIGNLQAVTPSASASQFGDILYDGDAAFLGLSGLTSADQFSLLWEGWFNVGADGPGEYTFGTRSDDGSVVYLDLNNDGDFDDPGEYILNNNYLQGSTVRTATVVLPMDKVRFAIGFFEDGGGQVMEARFAKGGAVEWADQSLIGGTSGLFSSTAPPDKPSSAALWYANYQGDVAMPTNPQGTQLVLLVPLEVDITDFNPEFLISPGATCDPPSGTYRDFTTPQSYTVTSQDSLNQTVYTLTVYQVARYDFNGGNLQGWRNVVWDLSANGGAGGWIELAPDATTMPGTVNGGAIQPPSADNGLFGVNGGEVHPLGHIDNHLNTHWLRSPAFYVNAVADLTVQLRRGVAHTTDPTDEASVPYAAITNAGSVPPGGWKGVVLRRASDGAFLYAKPRTGANGDEWRTVTFTKAELTLYDGVACTLELINSDRGGWGWLTMDNVSIPTTGLVPLSPYDYWRSFYPDLVGAAGAPDADADLDGSDNLTEAAFGTNPMSGLGGPIDAEGGFLYARGQPAIATDGGMAIVFGRRNNYLEVGLVYTVQFSEDLVYWEDSSETPTVIAADAEIDAVRVPFPATINPPGGPAAPRFARVVITTN